MNAQDKARRIEIQIQAIRTQRNLLQNKPWGASIAEEDMRLCEEQQALTSELNRIRPYKICSNGPRFVVAFKGMFVLDETGDNWISFATEREAGAWIAAEMKVAA